MWPFDGEIDSRICLSPEDTKYRNCGDALPDVIDSGAARRQ
jgi:hypothetical protein